MPQQNMDHNEDQYDIAIIALKLHNGVSIGQVVKPIQLQPLSNSKGREVEITG
ncbi:hypothetical protein [Staphylococcus coagulans]|uniref:hypothetical protein n=1 Tax=Staphylococcus coagulans TaxID=74706 RepID=UPI003364E098